MTWRRCKGTEPTVAFLAAGIKDSAAVLLQDSFTVSREGVDRSTPALETFSSQSFGGAFCEAEEALPPSLAPGSQREPKV